MAGHSKWKTIKRAKSATDKKRGILFTRLIREITMAAKLGGGDPSGNPRLRTAIDNAKAVSMPKENIERGIKKGTGDMEGVDYVETLYEAYGPGGVAIMIQAVTDNPTRTVADVRLKLSRNGGNMGSSNSVAYLFDRRGQMTVDAKGATEDALIEAALEAGAEDVERDEDSFLITTDPGSLHTVKEALEGKRYKVSEAELGWVAKSTVAVEGSAAEQLLKLLEALEELDDVQKVDANFEMDDDAMVDA
ncbi:MAG TPA: YebC/PmpR family DNA-binding transcriptional regulator [Gemmatimonas sp.]|nr:YebC/PmpR family DNA-binding transcriptional regulator [Gemmatimonas sp.]